MDTSLAIAAGKYYLYSIHVGGYIHTSDKDGRISAVRNYDSDTPEFFIVSEPDSTGAQTIRSESTKLWAINVDAKEVCLSVGYANSCLFRF
jgi:hypothetical protein